MIEFLVGLVAMLVLVGFLLQLSSLGRAQQETLTDARRAAGRLAFMPIDTPGDPAYIGEWRAGPDGRTYSRDDFHLPANQGAFLQTFTDPITTAPADEALMAALPHNPIGDLSGMTTPVNGFGLFSRRESEEIPLLPVVRHLLYRADSITLESEVWMPSLFGIY